MFCGAFDSMSPDRDDLEVTSFSSVPNDLIEEVRKVADSKGLPMLRSAYEEAIVQLCDDLEGGLKIDLWPSSRPGMAKAKETVRLHNDISKRMREMVKRQNIRKGVFFRVALARWLTRHGVDYNL